MFVVSEADGGDAVAAKLVADRDCRPVNPQANYLLCGPGGVAFPTSGPQQRFSSYCGENAADFRMYILDRLMDPKSAQ